MRDKQRADWVARNGAESAAAFDQRFPPGYFAHRAAFAPTGKYGRWLLSLPPWHVGGLAVIFRCLLGGAAAVAPGTPQ